MKHRNRFNKYAANPFEQSIVPRPFMASAKYCFEGEGGGSGEGGSGGGSGEGGSGEGNVTMSKAELASLVKSEVDAALKAQKSGGEGDGNDDPSGYQKAKDKIDQEEEEKQKLADMKSLVQFETGFDDFIKNNSSLFTMDSAKMREGAKGLEGKELQHSLTCIAAQNFFDTEANLELLSESDQNFIKNNILGQHERNIDSKAAWTLVQSAINVAIRLKNHGKQKGSSNNYDETEAPNVKKYIENCVSLGSGKKSAAA